MSWISSGIQRYETMDEINSRWDGLYDEIPTRTADENRLTKVGTFNNEQDARRALNRADICGFGYAEITSTKKESAKLRDARELLRKERAKLAAFRVDSSVYKTHNGKTVGCTHCGSSFPRDYFYKNGSYFYTSTRAPYAVTRLSRIQPLSA